MTFRSADFREANENVVLQSCREQLAGLVRAGVIEGKNRDRFCCRGWLHHLAPDWNKRGNYDEQDKRSRAQRGEYGIAARPAPGAVRQADGTSLNRVAGAKSFKIISKRGGRDVTRPRFLFETLQTNCLEIA
jgi:hypothetical protein